MKTAGGWVVRISGYFGFACLAAQAASEPPCLFPRCLIRPRWRVLLGKCKSQFGKSDKVEHTRQLLDR